MTELRQKLDQLIQRSIFIYQIIRYSFVRLAEERVPEVAAGLAFYGFFSLFPLMLILVAYGGSFLESVETQDQVLALLIKLFPFSGDVVERNIQQVLRVRGSVSTLSSLALAWSGSAAFAILARNINTAWSTARQRPFITRRLMALLILVVLVIVMFLLVAANTMTRFLPSELNGLAQVLMQMRYFSGFVMWILMFVSLITLYRWIPNISVTWAEGAWGSLVASTAIQVTTWGFSWYIRKGFINYSLVYGSLGAVAALLFWIYLIAFIALFGAHVSASIAWFERLGEGEIDD